MAETLDPLRIVRASLATLATSSDNLPPPVRAEIAFAGRSNVGKSSLLNALTGQRRLARTSSTPGCTRQLTFFDVETADKVELSFVDLPGYGFAQRSKAERMQWGKLIEDYLLERPTLRALVILFDVRRGLQQEERDVLELIASPRHGGKGPAPVLTATKIDTIALSKRKLRVEELRKEAGFPVVGTSANDARSTAQLWRRIRSAAGLTPPD